MTGRSTARRMIAVALAAALAWPASGQPAQERVSYPASFFAPFAPQTALDMIERLPGFTLDEGADVRGFGGAAGNVLIDGRRPSSKSGGVDEALARIPASQVKEIVLIRGSESGEAQGQSVVADVIRSGDGAAGTWQAAVERSAGGKVYPQLAATWTDQFGPWTGAFKANIYTERFPSHALRERTAADGSLIAARRDARPTGYGEIHASMEASRPLGRGTLRLNASGGSWAFDLDLNSAIYTGRPVGGAPDATQFYTLDEAGWDGELGADYALAMAGGWRFTGVALLNGRSFIGTQRDRTARGGGEGEGELLTIRLEEKPLEALVRTSFARGGATWRPELSVEAAYNRLDSRLTITAPSGVARAEALIEELRGEARASVGWTIAAQWTLDMAVAAELSRISVSGDADESQTLFFLKPSATLAWTPSETLQVRLSATRSAGQLDFSDFAASADSEADRESAGNPRLKPDQTTRLGLAVDWRFGKGGALSAELFREWREDALEFIPTENGGEAIGNAGTADIWGLKGSLTMPLNDMWQGLAFKAAFEVLETDIEDPVTGERRPLSNGNRDDPFYTAELRRDDAEGGFSYGVSYEHGFGTVNWYVADRDRLDYGAQWNAFIETTKIEGLKIRLESRSLAGERYRRTRQFFEPDRSGALDEIEQRRSRRGAFVKLTVSGSF